ncbi:uncharacterized protein TRIADDRAFT_22839 [Trichoplax adhaerens]|uniref:Polypeptide N-acetylgalactosaminyltransferase n=1 Tax=Trichoplax adhaerens TaxID=10228 RepID=B3RQX8_TRIAD|nr:hypothetical protein TRIADDRAFT_22839 [Trichoplax adhaerens]EDV26244.1 hypothetical protein TRIADDRAFT_22839 [Trichoplax adhaerens]|eukprot:XP_002110240.1 hypothetical protein TRIADDRAFT_22839 [Trichoplax adhaerens]
MMPAFRPTLPHYRRNSYGENGQAVVVPAVYKEESDRLFSRNRFNQWASDRISLHRTLPDQRPAACRKQLFPTNLPPASLVIVFHNEAWSTLLRTVHSVLDRSDPRLMREIILVDDCSEIKGHEELQAPLEKYIQKLKIVKLVRNKKRQGLIRARLRGYKEVTSPVIVFLDAHCEVVDGWLEPLLARIHENRSNVVCPEIDVISFENFGYSYASGIRGVFNWNLHFRWRTLPAVEQQRRKSVIDPIRSPTMAGGLFAIHKKYFEDIGLYDDEMDIWGGENLEMSFRIWQCGGNLEIIPCSHVGHVFRKSQPYTFPKGAGETLNKNLQRVAEVWMDNYKDIFYNRFPNLRQHSYGDISKRIELRKKLKCKSFDWYLKNVFTDVQYPDMIFLAKGELRNPSTGYCLDSMGNKEYADIGIYPCHGQGGNQLLTYTIRKELEMDEVCLDALSRRVAGTVKMAPCHRKKGTQLWEHKEVSNDTNKSI